VIAATSPGRIVRRKHVIEALMESDVKCGQCWMHECHNLQKIAGL
jgi:hypothetical protein